MEKTKKTQSSRLVDLLVFFMLMALCLYSMYMMNMVWTAFPTEDQAEVVDKPIKAEASKDVEACYVVLVDGA